MTPNLLRKSIVLLALSTTLVGAAQASPSASIEQVRNGKATDSSPPASTWGTGNAGASNSHYLESHSIPYRVVMGDLPTDGTVIELVVGYNPKRSGSYAIDYLTHFQRVLPHVMFSHSQPETFDPLAGVTGVSSTVTTAAIPVPTVGIMVDPDGAQSEPAALQPATNFNALSSGERLMTLFGGTVLDVTYVTEGDVGLATTSSATEVKIRFTADSPKAVLSWGGHIACRWDWGFNGDGSPRSAGGISGSSYHMQLIGWNLGSLGSQDRSMSTDAVYPVPHCGVSNTGPFCANTNNTHTAPTGMETYAWSFADNSSGATIVGSSTGSSVVVNSGAGGSYTLVLTTGASGFTKQCQGTITVNAPAWANAGLDQTVCASTPQVSLAGQIGGGTGTWSGGAGTWSPNASSMNAVYTPTANEINAGGVTLTLTATAAQCGSVSDQVRITIERAATANAGADLAVCATAPQAQLAGQVGGGATAGTWSGGAGSFAPSASALNAVYTPTAAEIAAGSVTLTLTTVATGGPCPTKTDQVTIAINPAATVNAGADLEVCSSAPQAQLAGQVGGGAASGTWSGGAGSFSPNATTLNAKYTPTAAEIAAGSVTLTLTTNDPAGPCGALSDQVRIDIRAAAVVNAGVDLSTCSTSPTAQLAGSVNGGASTGSWSGGAGNFSPNASALNATYTPTAAEIAAGSVTLTLTSTTVPGSCPQVSDQVTISILPAATVNAGVDREVCSSAPQVVLAGQVGGGASGGLWSGGNGTWSPNASTLGATYTPSAAEIAAGSVTLTLTTNDPAGPCGALADQVRINIRPAAIANAGADLASCSSSPRVQLQGSVTGGASSGTWSGGAGSFSPGASSLDAQYTPSAAEIAAGSVTLTLTSTAGSGPCPTVTDQVTIFISQALTVNAGADEIVCPVSPQVQLAGVIGNGALTGTWTGGAGQFQPNASTLDAIYVPTATEIAAGGVTLTLTTNDPAGSCPSVSDQMRIIVSAPRVAVQSKSTCFEITSSQLCADITGGVAPYTYLWSNGATTRCIAVADTGAYTVMITDSKGCQDTATGRFTHRDCAGMIAHTNTTCQSYMDGYANPILDGDINMNVSNGVITNIAPGVFFYYTIFTAPSSDFRVDIVQENCLGFRYIEVLHSQVSLYDANCTGVSGGEIGTDGQAYANITGATPGQAYVVSVKYSLKSLVGQALPDGAGCRYEFITKVNGIEVDRDPEGLTIGTWTPPVVEEEPSGGGESGNDETVIQRGDPGEAGKLPPPTNPAPTPETGGGEVGGNETPIERGGTADGTQTPPAPSPVPAPGPGGLSDKSGSAGGTGAGTVTTVSGVVLERPMPNPFQHSMRMSYAVAEDGTSVEITIFDLAGRRMRSLVRGDQSAGIHDVQWDGRDESGARVRKGMYFVHVRIGHQARQVRVAFMN